MNTNKSKYHNLLLVGWVTILLFLCTIRANAQEIISWTPNETELIEIPANGDTITITLDIINKPAGFQLQILNIQSYLYYPHVLSYQIQGDQISLNIGKSLHGSDYHGQIDIETNAGSLYIITKQELTGEPTGGLIQVYDDIESYPKEINIISFGYFIVLFDIRPSDPVKTETYFWEERIAGTEVWHRIPEASTNGIFYAFSQDCYLRRGVETLNGILYSNEVFCKLATANDIAERKNIKASSTLLNYNEYIDITSTKILGGSTEASYRWECRYSSTGAWNIMNNMYEEIEQYKIQQKTWFRRIITFEGQTFTSNEVVVDIRELNGGTIALQTPGTESGKRIWINSVELPIISNVTYSWETKESATSTWTTVAGATGTTYQTPTLTSSCYYRRKATAGTQILYSNEVFISVISGSHIKTYTYLQPITTNSDSIRVTDISWLGGFGREIQKTMVAASPTGDADIITPIVYGKHGRIEKSYLPYAKLNNNGAYDHFAFTPTNWNIYGTADQNFAFTQTTYDNSPLDRVVSQTGPGAAWHNNHKSVNTEYGTNAANEVKIWRVTNLGALEYSGVYSASTLSKIRTTDEDGQVSETFSDRTGKTVLTVNFNGSERLETYSVYDDRGQLCYVLSPEATRQLGTTVSTTILDALAYRYKYDGYGRMIEKQLPGCAPIYTVYDAKDRPVLTQDGNQRTAGKWSYSRYDHQNRTIEIGDIPLTNNRETLQHLVRANTNVNPGANTVIMQQLHYDDYQTPTGFISQPFLSVNGYDSSYHTLTAGLVTQSRTRILDTEEWITTTNYYDDHCRVIQTVSNNQAGGTSRICTAYDFIGNPIKIRESHSKSTGGEDVVETINTYDNRGRLLSQSTTLNATTTANISYNYDAVGRLQSKTFGAGEKQFTEQNVYNIRGWLTQKSSSHFNMKLHYQDTVTSTPARYNGNISAWEWQQGSGTPTQYAFTYDGVNRLSSASYYTQTGGAWTLSDKYAEKIPSYDRNGNITKLIRTSQTGSPVTLNYAYSGNKLTALSGSLTGSYTYDVNGNMINDSRKALNIKYNSLNLLSSVNNGQAKYSYLADGTKLRVRNSAGTEGFDYLGSLIYRCDASGLNLESVSFGDGRIVKNSVQPTVQYFQTDHLGSIRTIVDGATGSVLERNDYYPFGSKHIRTDYALASNPTNRFLFNGKEKQVTGGLNFLDYGWRMYDEEVGRWFGMDPMAEKYYAESSYSFCGNNPIVMLDENGMDYWSTNDPAEIGRFLGSLNPWNSNSFESFDYGSWNHETDTEFLGNLTYNDITRTFLSSYGTVLDNMATRIGVSFKACMVVGQNAMIQTLYGREIQAREDWFRKSSGEIDQNFLIEALTIPTFGWVKAIKWGKLFGKQVSRNFDDLVREAQKIYPKKAGKIENHHILPQYMGGAKNGKVVPLDGAYHQMITNEFRKKWSYGMGKIKEKNIQREIMDAVYKEFPLPPGYSY